MAYPDDWKYKCELTIEKSKVPSTLSNFPILITKDTLPADMYDADSGKAALDGGGDIRFSSDSAGSTRLSCEIVSFITDDNPANAVVEIYVKVPTVNGTGESASSKIYVWWGKTGETQPAVGDPYGRNDVWSNGFKGVWHLQETASGGTETSKYVDSTGRNTAADKVESGGDITTETAKILNGQKLDTNAYIDLHNGSDLRITGNALSLSLWAYPRNDGWSGGTRLMSKRQTSLGYDAYALIYEDTGAGGRLTTRVNNESVNTGLTITKNAWNHCFGTYDGTNIKTYLNGTKGTDKAYTGNIVDSTIQVCLGHRYGEDRWFDDGTIDEVRIANVARSADWITAEYNNQNAPSTFITEGSIVVIAQTIIATGITSGEALGAAKLNLTVVGTGISSGETFGAPALYLNCPIYPNAIASTEAFGAPSIAMQIIANSVDSGEAFGVPLVNLFVVPAAIDSQEVFGSSRIKLVLNFVGNISSEEAFGVATLFYEFEPFGIPTTELFGTPRIVLALLPTGVTSSEVFGTPALIVIIFSPAIPTEEVFGVPALLSDNVGVLPETISSAESFGSLRVNQQVLPASVLSEEIFGTPVLVLKMEPSSISSEEAFGNSKISLQIRAVDIISGEIFGSLHLTYVLYVQIVVYGIPSKEVFGNARLNLELLPNGVLSEEEFGFINVALGQFVSIDGIDTEEAFGIHKIVTFTKTTFKSYVEKDMEGGLFNLNEFGETASYTFVRNESTISIKGIFDNEYRTIDPDTGVGIMSTEPVFWTATRNFKRKPTADDRMIIRGVNYRVIRHEPDGTGLSMLYLHQGRTE